MNILAIVIDTLRADHLGCYGYERNTSPNIDAFAAESTVFDHMIAPAIPTHPAFATLCTGQYSITHGVVAHGGHGPVPRTSPWLPALMQKAGYTTCAIDNLADWRHGFGRGYEFYIDPSSRRTLNINCDNREINRRAIPWLEAHRDENFFMMVHYWDPHTPYLPPRAYRRLFYKGDPEDPDNTTLAGLDDHPLGKTWRETWLNKLGNRITDAEYLCALYDGEIRYCDEGIARLLKALDRIGLADNTAVFIMSDHGEMMYRHGIFFDHHGLYDGNIRVPFIVRHPDLPAGRWPHLAATVDFAPTVLDLCGIDVPGNMEGKRLTPVLRDPAMDPLRDFVVAQECTWQMKWAIRTANAKLILALEEDYYGTPMRELYDLETDPHELNNLAEADPARADALEKQLRDWLAAQMAERGLTEDPLQAHGLTLGKRWQEGRIDQH